MKGAVSEWSRKLRRNKSPMNLNLKFKRPKLAFLAILYFLLFLIFLWDPFKNFELLTFDTRMKLRPAIPVSDDILIITIDDETLSQLGQWPLPRDFHASLLDVLTHYGARAVAFDLIFSEPSPEDATLAESFQRAGNVYLPLVFYLDNHKTLSKQSAEQLPLVADITPALKDSAHSISHINAYVDADGKTRRVPLILNSANGPIPQMAFAIAQRAFKTPLPQENELIINYPGKWNRSFTLISYIDLLKKYKSVMDGNSPEAVMSFLKNKICIVGLTAAGTPDLRSTPLENIYPMVGVHASVLNSIITQRFIHRVSPVINLFLTLVLFTLSLFISFRWPPLTAMLGNLLLLLIYIAQAFVLFAYQGIWIDLFQPIFFIVVTYTGGTVFRIFAEIKRRELLEQELNIAKQIQQSFLPKNTKISSISFNPFFQPAKFVAGDFYDVIPLTPTKTCVVIGDVAGKGVSAALIMAQAISLFRIFARKSDKPAEILTELNKELAGHLSGRFITMLCLVLDSQQKSVSAATAGHGPLYCYKSQINKMVQIDLPAGVPLGLIPQSIYSAAEINLLPEDQILLFSDGVYEARNKAGAELGMEQLRGIVEQYCRNNTLEKSSKEIIHELFKFTSGAEQHDDITFLILSLQSSDSSNIMTSTKNGGNK